VSQRQKQATNQKRASRLGTGEGIARDKRSPRGGGGGRPGRGVSSWVWWAVGLVGVVAVAVGIGVTVFGGGSDAGGGNRSAVVTDRLATDRIDFTSEGTWQPNGAQLGAVIAALGLPAASDLVEHYHSHLTLVVDGHEVPIPANLGIDLASNTVAPIHTHDERGVIHTEADQRGFRTNLQQVFDLWGVRLTSSCVAGYCDGVKIWVNGKQVSSDPSKVVLQPHDAVTVLEGPAPKNFTPDKTFKFANGE
jgi:hypothetical protein